MKQDELENIFKKTYLIRACENALIAEYHKDEIKTPLHLSIGAELIPSVITNQFPLAKYFGTYRSHALFLAQSNKVKEFFCELYGKQSGISAGKAGSMHLFDTSSGILATSAIVASTIPLAVGAALANKLQGSDNWSIVFMGDGSMEEGVFFESLNFCSVHNLKVIFVVEDNDLAIHVPKNKRQSFLDYSKLSSAFNVNYQECSGVDLQSLYNKCLEIKNDNTPTLFRCNYHRFYEHVGIHQDYDFDYRSKPKNLKQLDPLNSFNDFRNKDEIIREVDQRVKEALEFAKADTFLPKEEAKNYVF